MPAVMRGACSTLELILLALCRQQPRTGYALRTLFAKTPMGHYSSSPGAIYPALRRLSEKGLVRGARSLGRTRRPRETFSVTARGGGILKAWLVRPVTREDVVWRQEELMARFAFMEAVASPGQVLDFLSAFQREFHRYAAELAALHAELRRKPGHSVLGLLALQGGLEGYRARERWARRARIEIQSGHGQTRTKGERT